jgi:hypothetical protein
MIISGFGNFNLGCKTICKMASVNNCVLYNVGQSCTSQKKPLRSTMFAFSAADLLPVHRASENVVLFFFSSFHVTSCVIDCQVWRPSLKSVTKKSVTHARQFSAPKLWVKKATMGKSAKFLKRVVRIHHLHNL